MENPSRSSAPEETMSTYSRDIRVLKPLRVIAEWIGFLPRKRGLKYLYALIVVVINLFIYSYGTYGKIAEIPHVFDAIVHFIDLTCDLSITITIITSIIWVNICNAGEVEDFFTTWRNIDKEFLYVNVRKRNTYFYLELIMAHLLFTVSVFFDASLWIKSIGFKVYQYYIFKPVQIYSVIVLAMLLRHYALSIKYRFEILNEILANFNLRSGKSVVLVGIKYGDAWDVKRICRVYTRISVAIEQYNAIFGMSYVNLYIWIIVNLLMPIDVVLVYGSGNNKVMGTSFGADLVMLCLIWSSIPVAITCAIFSPCQKATSEAEKTTNICYSLLHDLSSNEADYHSKIGLEELAQQASSRSLCFSAAGFFTINYNVIYSMIGSISSYLIVLIQFNK